MSLCHFNPCIVHTWVLAKDSLFLLGTIVYCITICHYGHFLEPWTTEPDFAKVQPEITASISVVSCQQWSSLKPDISSNQISLRSNSWPVIVCEHLVVKACKNRATCSVLWISFEVVFRVSHLIPEIKDTALKDQPTSARFTRMESQWQ